MRFEEMYLGWNESRLTQEEAAGIDSLETYKRVLEINPKQKAILVSGFSDLALWLPNRMK